jgi:hypothetical protein
LDNSNPYQVESATRPAGGSWSAVTTVSPNAPQTWTPQIALDSAGNATAVWEQGATVNNYRIYASTRPAGGAWSGQTRIEPGTWYYAGNDAIATDSAGNVTAAWLVEDSSGSSQIRAARKPAGGAWGTVSSLGPCTTSVSLCSTPQVAASPDGSLTAVGWAAYGSSNAPNVAVRLGTGAWTRTVLSTNNAQVVNTMASNSAHASTVWPEPAPGRHMVILKQSDYK